MCKVINVPNNNLSIFFLIFLSQSRIYAITSRQLLNPIFFQIRADFGIQKILEILVLGKTGFY